MAELDREKVLDNVMLDLEISKDDDDSIDLLRVLLNRVISHFKAEYAVVNIDDGFSFIFEDCVIKRFNRRGAEGAKTETVDGHSKIFMTKNVVKKNFSEPPRRTIGILSR